MPTLRSKNALIYRVRRVGYRINTRQRTIYVMSNSDIPYCKAVDRLIAEHGFVIQYQDPEFGNIEDFKFYISLPINARNPSTSDYYDIDTQRRLAQKAQKVLAKLGYRTFNPFQNGVPDGAPVYQHMRADYQALCTCSAICLLPGWQYSNGCKHELMLATDMRMRVYVMDDNFNISQI